MAVEVLQKRKESMTPEERQALLRDADQRYISGEIDLDEYDRLNREYGTDFEAAFAEMASLHRLGSRLIERIRFGTPRESGPVLEED